MIKLNDDIVIKEFHKIENGILNNAKIYDFIELIPLVELSNFSQVPFYEEVRRKIIDISFSKLSPFEKSTKIQNLLAKSYLFVYFHQVYTSGQEESRFSEQLDKIGCILYRSTYLTKIEKEQYFIKDDKEDFKLYLKLESEMAGFYEGLGEKNVVMLLRSDFDDGSDDGSDDETASDWDYLLERVTHFPFNKSDIMKIIAPYYDSINKIDPPEKFSLYVNDRGLILRDPRDSLYHNLVLLLFISVYKKRVSQLTASQYIKMCSTESMQSIMEITGVSRSTLNDWYKTKRDLFDTVVMGCRLKTTINQSG